MSTPLVAPPPTTEELLAQYGTEVVWLRNSQPGPTVFTADAKSPDGYITWQGAGHPGGEDIMPVPKTMLSSVQLQNTIRRGILTVVDNPAVQQAAIDAQQQAWNAQEARRQNTNPDAVIGLDGTLQEVTMDRAGAEDMIVEACLGGMPANPCGDLVSLRPKEVGVKPPLCAAHGSLAGQFISQEDHTRPLVNGKAPMKWVRPHFGG